MSHCPIEVPIKSEDMHFESCASRMQIRVCSLRSKLVPFTTIGKQQHRLQDYVRDEAKQIWRNLDYMRSRVQIRESDFVFVAD